MWWNKKSFCKHKWIEIPGEGPSVWRRGRNRSVWSSQNPSLVLGISKGYYEDLKFKNIVCEKCHKVRLNFEIAKEKALKEKAKQDKIEEIAIAKGFAFLHRYKKETVAKETVAKKEN